MKNAVLRVSVPIAKRIPVRHMSPPRPSRTPFISATQAHTAIPSTLQTHLAKRHGAVQQLRATFGAGFTAKLTAALVSIKEKKPELLKVFPRNALIPADNAQYESTRKVMEAVGL